MLSFLKRIFARPAAPPRRAPLSIARSICVVGALGPQPNGPGSVPCPVCTTGTLTFNRWGASDPNAGAWAATIECSSATCVKGEVGHSPAMPGYHFDHKF